MDIIVKGQANEFFKPDQIILDLNFYTKMEKYNQALEQGVKNVERLITEILNPLNFKKEDLKTRSFSISEVLRYDSEKKQNFNDGFAYSQKRNFKI